MADDFVDRSGADRLSCLFGLSYAKWLIVSRAQMESMPDEWQGRAAELFEEFWDAWDWDGVPDLYATARKNGRFTKLPKWMCEYRRELPELRARLKHKDEE